MKPKSEKIAHYERIASERRHWRARNAYYYDWIDALLRKIVRTHASVLELGCGTGESLRSLSPSRGVGVDFSPRMIALADAANDARERVRFVVGDAEALEFDEPFDYVICNDLIGELTDVWATLRGLRRVTNSHSRVVITHFNEFWEPILRVGELLGLKMPQDNQNWLDLGDIRNLLELNGFEVVSSGYELPLPARIPFVSELVNRYIARLPLINRLGLATYVVARKREHSRAAERAHSVSVVIPCRNERGNIRDAVARIPDMGTHTEIVFVDGASTDGTVEEIESVICEYSNKRDIKLIHQLGRDHANGGPGTKMLALGKGDAVRKGFDAATGEVLMILDADLTVPPEQLGRFYDALVEGYGELINGCRMIYPMESDAMRFLNKIANKLFGLVFSFLLGQRIKDTLCGTKVLYRSDYLNIAAQRAHFGDFDPFGDFDLLFGAARQNLRIVEMPVHYRNRTYGDIKIERFKHGLLLLKMSFIAMKRIRFY